MLKYSLQLVSEILRTRRDGWCDTQQYQFLYEHNHDKFITNTETHIRNPAGIKIACETLLQVQTAILYTMTFDAKED